MSTKTTLKRVALVAVSALGFGLMSVVPSKAAAPDDNVNGTANNFTSGITLSGSSYTVVDPSGSASTTTGTMKFYVDTTRTFLVDGASGYTAGVDSNARPLLNNETITVSVSAKTATAQATDDLSIQHLVGAISGSSLTFTTSGSANTSSVSVTGQSSASRNGSFSTVGALNNENNRYWFALTPADTNVFNNGAYTIRVRLQNANSAIVDRTFTVSWVTDIADSGARVTVTQTGTILTGAAYAYTETSNTKAVLDNGTTGGRLLLGTNVTTALSASRPTLDANIMTGATASVVGDVLTITDAGTAGQDYVAGTTATTPSSGVVASGTPVSKAESESLAANSDGVYGAYTASTIAAAASTTTRIRVRVLNTSASGTAAVVIAPANSATALATTVLATAAGLKASDTVSKGTGSSTCTSACAISYNVPTTTSSVSLAIDTNAAAGSAITSNVSWGGNYASANVTPASDTTVVNYVDADGKFTIALTNTSAVNTGAATIALTGFASAADKVTITVTWQTPTVSSVTVVDPVSGVYVKTKSKTTFSVLVQDQFGNAMASQQVIPSLSSTSANYSATTTYAPVTTNASGIATWDLTDAAGTDTVGDSVTFTSVLGGVGSTPFGITYRATLPVVANVYEFYNDTYLASPSSTNVVTAVPSTGIMKTATAALDMQIDRDLSKDLSAAATEGAGDDMIQLRVRALTSAGVVATGAPITITASAGGHVLDVSGLPATSRTSAVNSTGDVFFKVLATKPGTITFTVTSGSVSDTVRLIVADPGAANARTVAISGAATGTANGEGIPMTVTVTDRYGNGVKDVTLTITASGVGAFMGGATSQSFTTDNTGRFTFLATSYAAAGGAGTFTATASNAGDAESIAGFSGATPVDSTLAAGKKTASATVTFAAGQNASQVAAEAATDAALEAIDAANAATDAANLAAEAADAATVAAEEARDAADAATAAVEALASEVATLIAGLKAQITTLANTVAKIAKRVRA